MTRDHPQQATADLVAPGQAPVIELRGVSKAYPMPKGRGTRLAVTDINLIVDDVPQRGQCRVFLGPSGCGKSTILKLIAGLLDPTEGEVLVDGAPVEGPCRERGMVFQSYSSFPWMNVLENVRFGLDLAGEPRDEANARSQELIDLVGLSGS